MNERSAKRYARAVPAALLVLAAGCSLQPAYQQPPLSVASAYPTGPAYKPLPKDRRALPAVDIGWRDFLKDPRLQRLVAIALRDNRDLRVSMLNVEATRAQYRIERSALFPQVSVFADGTRSRTPADLTASGTARTSGDWEGGVSASWAIDFFGRLRSLTDAQFQLYLASAQARKAEEILLVSQVADQYLTMLAYDELLSVTERQLETSRAQYRIVLLQFNTGTTTELSVRQAQTVVEQAEANHAAYVRLRAQAENALVLLLGVPLPADLPPAAGLGEQPILADVPAGLPADLLTRRPDIMQAESSLRAEYANIGAARAAFFPAITLTGALGTASAALDGLFKAGSAAWSFTPSLTTPIFEGGALDANLDLARVEKDIGVAQYEKTVQSAFREVADGLAARGTYDDQVAALERYVADEQRSLDLAWMRYRSGADNYLGVLTAQTDLYMGQQLLVSARLSRLTNLVDLYEALGGGWIERTGEAPPPPEQTR